jgi:hypothetical protein
MVKYDSFDTAKDIPDLSGKVILVTGGPSSLSPSHPHFFPLTPSQAPAA